MNLKGLNSWSPSEGIAAMQSINITVLNPWFLGAFFGTAAAYLLALVAAMLRWYKPEAVYLLIASAFYLVGTVLVTIVCNVPKNEALASVVPADPDGASLWAGYIASWTAWNHVRTAASLAAAALFSIALGY